MADMTSAGPGFSPPVGIPQAVGRASLVSLACLPMVPASLVLYAAVAFDSQKSLAGLLDAGTFLVAVTALLWCCGRLRSRLLRSVLFLSLALAASLLFVGNTHYDSAFHDWIQPYVLGQWRLGPSIAGGVMQSLTPWDLGLGIVVPLGCAVVAASRQAPSITLRGITAMLLLLAATISGHRAMSGARFDASQHNLAMHLIRESWRAARQAPPSFALEGVDLDEFYPAVAEGYRRSSQAFPLMQVPEFGGERSDAGRSPNVVLVLMESVRALESGAYGAEVSFTPELDALAQQGLRFANFYANGTQTVRGELALLCSYYPDLNGPSIYRSRPATGLSCLPDILAKRGYSTLWISGHRKTYSNKYGFLSRHGMQEFYDNRDYPESAAKIGWGIADETIFERAERILDEQPQPFFAEIMTLSNHWPFDWDYPTIAATPVIEEADQRYIGYTRGIYYTDWAIGRFMERMRTKPYFDDTVFAFVADHGIWLFPTGRELETIRKQEAYFRMPFVLYAPGMVEAGVVADVGSQVDFAPTLLDLLDVRARNAFVGQSLLSPPRGLERHALMMHVRQWNLRAENRYLYDVSREFFEEHFPTPPEGYLPGDAEHVLLESESDLLRVEDAEAIRFGADERRERMTEWAERLVQLNRQFLESDRIFAK